MKGDLSHLRDYLIKGDRLIVKVPSVDQVRIVPHLDRTVVIFLIFTFLKAFPPSSRSGAAKAAAF